MKNKTPRDSFFAGMQKEQPYIRELIREKSIPPCLYPQPRQLFHCNPILTLFGHGPWPH